MENVLPKLRTGLRDKEAKASEVLSDFKTLNDPSLLALQMAGYDFMVEMGSSTARARWLTLLGPSGTGKTMIAKRCYRYFRRHLDPFLDERFDPHVERRLRRAIFKPWVDVVRNMLEGDYSEIREMRECWFLVIDDIGAEYSKVRELATSKLYEVLNAREGLWTIITANLSLEQIATTMDARIASRMLRNKSDVIDVKAVDFNLRQ